MEEVASSIADKIHDYCDGFFGKLDTDHVMKWVYQFDTNDRVVVLEETNRILNKTYLNINKIKHRISRIISPNYLTGDNPNKFWENTSILNIQTDGNSQNELSSLLTNAIEESYGIKATINKESDFYLYFDDSLFSGNRTYNDITTWISNNNVNNCHIEVAFIGWHSSGQYSTYNKLVKFVSSLNKNISFNFRAFKDLKLENRVKYNSNSEVLWPTASVLENIEVNKYIQSQKYPTKFRVDNGELNEIFSRRRRDQYELAMLKAGLKIINFCESPSFLMKPLGYNFYDGLGFGSVVFTYRNCPNNNPLAFWWGDPKYSSAHPFGKWYPLMQRKTYG